MISAGIDMDSTLDILESGLVSYALHNGLPQNGNFLIVIHSNVRRAQVTCFDELFMPLPQQVRSEHPLTNQQTYHSSHRTFWYL